MISYRKLAMRVLGHSPVSAVKTARRSTGKRAAALALTAALVVGMTLPAFADTWYIEDGDISISAGENGNNVTQEGGRTKENDTDTVITNRESTASSNTVTINADEGKTVNVTLDNVTINVDERNDSSAGEKSDLRMLWQLHGTTWPSAKGGWDSKTLCSLPDAPARTGSVRQQDLYRYGRVGECGTGTYPGVCGRLF